jgi:hypothetical protein
VPTSISEPDIWGVSLIEASHSRDLIQLARHGTIVVYMRRRNSYYIPNVGSLAQLVADGLCCLAIAKVGNLADYEDSIT